MTEAVKQFVLHIQNLTEHLTPEEADAFIAALNQKVAELEEEKEWEALVSTPESQAFLEQLSARVDEQIKAGKTYGLDAIL